MPSALAVLDISRLRRISEDDESFLQEVLDELLQDTSQQVAMLLRAVEQADLTTCASVLSERFVCKVAQLYRGSDPRQRSTRRAWGFRFVGPNSRA